MKMKMKFNFFLIAIVLVALLSSCSIEKRFYKPGYHVDMKNNVNKTEKTFVKNSKKSVLENTNNGENTVEVLTEAESFSHENNLLASNDNNLTVLASIHNAPEFSNIYSNTKEKDIQVNSKPIFKKSIYKKDQTKSIISNSDDRKTHWGAIVGLVTGIVGLFIFGIILGICAIVFSAIALSAIKKNPDKYKGKGMAIAGLVIGIVGIGLFLILLAILL